MYKITKCLGGLVKWGLHQAISNHWMFPFRRHGFAVRAGFDI